MAAGTVAGVYAQALLELADERGKRAAVVDSCRALVGDGRGSAALPRALIDQLDDPRLGKGKAKAVLAGALAGSCEQEVIDLLRLLVDRNRLSDAPAILAEAVHLDDEAAGRILVSVVSAIPLSAVAQAAIVGGIDSTLGDAAVLSTSIDPAMLGGLTIRVGDIYIDGSIRRKLSVMKSRILDVQLTESLWSEIDPPRSPA